LTGAWAIARREFAAFFRLPTGWVVVALYLLLSGIVFAATLRPGEPASLRSFFYMSSWLLLFVAPAVSMRLVSEEVRTGTLEPLMTAPVSDWAIGVGKYAGGLGFLVVMALPTLLYVGLLEWVSDPDYGPILAGYVGLLLVGMLYIAIGLLASAATSSQTVAFLGTLFFLLLAQAATTQGAAYLGPPFDKPLYAASVQLRLGDFAKGMIDTGHVVFFAAGSAWFVALSVLVLQSRRWR